MSRMHYTPGRDHFNVWRGFPEGQRAAADAYAEQLRAERPGHPVAICGPLAQGVSPRARFEAERNGHRWLVGIFDRPGRGVRIPGLNAPQ